MAWGECSVPGDSTGHPISNLERLQMPQTTAAIYAWLGGLAFVASLAYFVYFHVSVLGHAAALAPYEAGALQATAWNGVLFGAFALHHSVMARTGAKQWIAAWLPSTLERSTYVWIASALFFATCFSWRLLPGELYAAEGLWRWTGYAVQLGGLALIARSVSMLDVLDLAGIRQVSEPRTRPVEPAAAPAGRPPRPQLRVDGPYGTVRHPLYLGWVLVVCGAPHMTANRVLFACISTVYLLLAIPWEERSMVETFGDTYTQYAARVRSKLIPGVY